MSLYNKVEICGVNTAKLPLLKSEEQEELWDRIEKGDKEAREKFIQGNLRLVLSITKRFSGNNENIDDLFQIGCIGLIKAIDNFDRSVGVKFSTYAVPTNIPSREITGGLKMTRKQAISQAISILEKDESNHEICEKLQEILEELPLTHWSDKTIFDAFDQYILEHNCLPSRTEIKLNSKIPTHPTIKNRFGLTLEEFYQKYYCDYINKNPSRIYHYQSVDYWLDNFKKQYIKNNYPPQKQYDALREDNTPSSRHIIKIAGYKNWNELLYYCGFKMHGHNNKSTIKVRKGEQKCYVRSSYQTINEEQIEKINNYLQKYNHTEKS